MWLVPRQRAAPLYWRSSSHTHTHTTIRPSNPEGMDAQRDKAMDAVAVDADMHRVEAVHKCPYHMSEGHS